MFVSVCALGETFKCNNCNLAISSLTEGKEKGRGAGNKEHHGERNTRDYQFRGCCFASSTHPLLWHSLCLSEANIHFRSAISNVTGPLLAQGYRTKVYPPFISTFSPGPLMNITNWFTKAKDARRWHSLPLWFLEHPQRKCFLLKAFHCLECPSSYRPCNRKWGVLP